MHITPRVFKAIHEKNKYNISIRTISIFGGL